MNSTLIIIDSTIHAISLVVITYLFFQVKMHEKYLGEIHGLFMQLHTFCKNISQCVVSLSNAKVSEAYFDAAIVTNLQEIMKKLQDVKPDWDSGKL